MSRFEPQAEKGPFSPNLESVKEIVRVPSLRGGVGGWVGVKNASPGKNV